MIRRIIDFLLILIFVWSCMFLGLLTIDMVIVPLVIPIGGLLGAFLTSSFKVLSALLLILVWLWVWREIVKRFFWHEMKKR